MDLLKALSKEASFKFTVKLVSDGKYGQYQPSGEGGTCSPPATPHCLQNPKGPPGGPKMADGVWFLGILSNFR